MCIGRKAVHSLFILRSCKDCLVILQEICVQPAEVRFVFVVGYVNKT